MDNIYLYRNCKPNEKKITSVNDLEEALAEYKKFEATKENLSKEDKLHFWKKEIEAATELIFNRCPVVLIAICPYCNRKVYANLNSGVFTLAANFWLLDYDNAKNVSPESLCEHLFAVDGSLHLQNNDPPSLLNGFKLNRDEIFMASEVPFVKPRILKKNGVLAVINSVLIAEKYTGYPVTYFSKEKIPQREFCIGWARKEYVDHLHGVNRATFSGKREDEQDYDLISWVKKGKLFWLEEIDSIVKLKNDEPKYPYLNIIGRKHPYSIKKGLITNYPNPVESLPKTEIETFMPGVE